MLKDVLAVGENPPCLFLGNCGMGTISCTINEMAGCSETAERQKRANQNCPIMEKVGGTNKKCHVPQLLPFLPLKFACHNGDDCVLCKIAQDTVAEVAKHNFEGSRSKMSAEDLEKAGLTVIEAIKIQKAERGKSIATAEKVAV
ncbi:MAG: hypothetical protein PHR36_00270 [Patescibacteria group bacterium]|nr:hypothetical protein [Patescibacteria group bacterium]